MSHTAEQRLRNTMPGDKVQEIVQRVAEREAPALSNEYAQAGGANKCVTAPPPKP